MSYDYVADHTGLFQVSGMVDALRDSAVDLGKVAAQDAVLGKAMMNSFNDLRVRLRSVLTESGRDALDGQVPFINEPSVLLVAFAAAQLSRFADVAHDIPRFEISERANAKAMAHVDEKLESSGMEELLRSAVAGSAGEKLADVSSAENAGMYL